MMQSGGRDFLAKSTFTFFQIHLFAGKVDFNTSVKNSSSSMGLWETAWGKMFVLTVGSFHVFTEIMTLICKLQVKVHVSPKTLISTSSVQTFFFLQDRYVRRLFP
jgi:hypothetical protein